MEFKKNYDYDSRQIRLLDYIYKFVGNNDGLLLRDVEFYNNPLFYKKELKTKYNLKITINDVLFYVNKDSKIVLFNKEQFELHVDNNHVLSFLLMDIHNITFEITKY